MSFAHLAALEQRQKRIREIASQVTGLKAQVDELVTEAEILAKEMEEISLRQAEGKES